MVEDGMEMAAKLVRGKISLEEYVSKSIEALESDDTRFIAPRTIYADVAKLSEEMGHPYVLHECEVCGRPVFIPKTDNLRAVVVCEECAFKEVRELFDKLSEACDSEG